MKVFDLYTAMTEEAGQMIEFEDERIASNLYLTSLSYPLRSLNTAVSKLREAERICREKANQWLISESDSIARVPALNLDAIKTKIDPQLTSCDAFLFNAGFPKHSKHFLGEFKNTSKSEMLKMIDSDGKDGLKWKAGSSLDLIKNEISFSDSGMNQECLEGEVHLILVYGGKNDKASPEVNLISRLPKAEHISRDARRKQKEASRQRRSHFGREKKTNDSMSRFEEFLRKKGFAHCTYEELPVRNALPKLSNSSNGKSRAFTLLTASDLAFLVDEGYFDEWDWGIFSLFL